MASLWKSRRGKSSPSWVPTGPKDHAAQNHCRTAEGSAEKRTIEFNGRLIQRLSPERISSFGIVYVPEDRGLFRELTVRENLELGCWGRSDKGIEADMNYVMDLFPILKERRNQQAETLSGGEQQMLAIARAFLRKPKLLMLDEPSLGLAPLIARNVCDALVKISNLGTTILLWSKMRSWRCGFPITATSWRPGGSS